MIRPLIPEVNQGFVSAILVEMLCRADVGRHLLNGGNVPESLEEWHGGDKRFWGGYPPVHARRARRTRL